MKSMPPLLFAAVLAAFCSNALASGSYSSRPPRITDKTETESDKSKWTLGLQVFNNRVKLVTDGDKTVQTPRLEKLQAMLPADVAKKKDLTTLSGKLTGDQLTALEHYVTTRFSTKK